MKKYIRLAIALTSSLLFVLILARMLSFDADREQMLALDFYQKGDYANAEQSINRIESYLTPMQYHLYLSYIKRGKKDLAGSNKELELSAKDAEDHANFPVLVEIYLNQAFNAYQAGDNKTIAVALKKAIKFGGPDNDWILVFRGILEYDQGNYAKALPLWKIDASRLPISPWMKNDFERVFNKQWFVTHLARSNIEIGNQTTARLILQEQIPQLKGKDLDDILLLLGLSYVKEAADKNAETALPYYKLASTYFKKIKFDSDTYKNEKEEILQQLGQQAFHLIESGDYQNMPAYIELLDKWQGSIQIAQVKQELLGEFQRASALGAVAHLQDLYNILRLVVPEGSERQQLELALQNASFEKYAKQLEYESRTGELFNASAPKKQIVNQALLFDPNADLEKIQKLIDKAVDDHRINPNFNIERSVDLQNALKVLTPFTTEHPDVSHGFILLGQVKYLLGDFLGSAKAYQTAINLDPRNPQIYRYLALVFEDNRQPHDAILVLLRGLKFAPKNGEIWEQLADLYLLTGNDLDALPAFREAIRITPNNYPLYYRLGRLQIKLEIPEEARKNLDKFLSQDPENKDALRLLLMALYNPLLNFEPKDLETLEKERNNIYERLYKLAPEDADKIRRSYHPPPAIISPPPEPEPNLPFFPQ